jgi:LCP family protein required for cell wall assembly
MPFAHSPSIASILSFVLPGLGQVSAGAVRRGALIATPAVAVFGAAVGLALAGGGTVMDTLLRPEILIGLLVLNLLLAAYHVSAIVDAHRIARSGAGRPLARRASALFLAILVVGTLSLHGALEAIGYQAYATLDSVFVPSEPGDNWAIPEPSFEPPPAAVASPVPATTPSQRPTSTTPPTPAQATEPSPSPAPSPTAGRSPSPSPTKKPTPPWAADGRLNLLLIGSDAGPDRWSLRTDTIVVLSIDVDTGRAALFGVPRNLVGVPLPPESAGAFASGRFPGLLNALYVYAMGHPTEFPGGDARGFRAVSGAVQELVGVRLDGVVVVNLAGFVRLVNALGGLWIDAPERLVDHAYPLEDGSGLIELDIRAGCQRLNGRMALAYARSRHQDSDYGRMGRQQAVLVALARQVDPIALLPKVPDLLQIARDNLWTTVRRTDVRGLAELAARVDTSRVDRVLFVPSRYPSHLDTAEIATIRHIVRTVFDGPAPKPSSDRGGRACP